MRLSCRYRRVVARDNTVRLGARWVQLRGSRSYAGLTLDVRELLDGRLVALHEGLVRGETPSPSGPFVLKPHRSPRTDRRPHRVRPTPAPPPPPPPTAAKTHTGRHALPTPPWVIAKNRDIRRREQRTGRTFSRRSDGGHFH